MMLVAVLVWGPFSSTTWAKPLRLRSPNRTAQMPSGHLLVSDHRLEGVAVWNPHTEQPVRLIRIPGRAMGVAMGWNRLFVGNARTGSVDVTNSGGRLLYVLGGEDGLVKRPSDLAIDLKRGLVFVSDTLGKKVWVFGYRGDLVRTLPAPGEIALDQPTGLTVDPVREEVLVSDYGRAGMFGSKAWVRIYDYEGRHLDSINGSGQPKGFRFSRPQGLVVNEQGLIYLVDSLLGQVLVFDRDTLQGVERIGELGTAPGQLFLPLDAVIDPRTGDLYVTNNRNARVEVFPGQGVLR